MEQFRMEQIAREQLVNQKWQQMMVEISNAAVREGKIAHATFELTAMCTLKCKMCYVRLDRQQADAIGTMRMADEWIHMARQFRDAGGITILLTGGEAMMRPDFAEIYEEISKMGLFVTVFTNGTTITDEIVDLFKRRPPALVGLTLYGASEETYRRVTGAEGFSRAVEGLDRLLAIPNLHVDVRYTLCTLNYEDYGKVQQLVAERGIILGYDFGDMSPVRGATSDSRKLRLSKEQKQCILEQQQQISAPILDAIHKMDTPAIQETRQLAPIDLEQENGEEPDSDMERRLQCRAAAFGVYIAFDGRMYPCDSFSEPYCTEPFKEGFVPAYQRLQKIAKDILVPESCFLCRHRERCGPCAARLIAEKEACKREGVPCGFEPREMK